MIRSSTSIFSVYGMFTCKHVNIKNIMELKTIRSRHALKDLKIFLLLPRGGKGKPYGSVLNIDSHTHYRVWEQYAEEVSRVT